MSVPIAKPNLNPRFLARNKAVAYSVAADAVSGFVTRPRPKKRGTGRLHASAGFSGQSEADYVVEITALQTFATGLTFPSQIFDGSVGIDFQYRWGRQFADNSGLTFIAHGVSGSTISGSLEQDISVSFQFDHPGITFVLGDFEVGDRWTFKARNPDHINSATRYPRDMRFKSPAGFTTTIVVGLTQMGDKRATCVALLDHNLNSADTITHSVGAQVNAISATDPGALEFSSDRIYFNQSTSALHTIQITSPIGPTAPQHEIGYLYLGKHREFRRMRDPEHAAGEVISGELGGFRARQLDYRQKILSFRFPLMVVGLTTNTDMGVLRELKEEAAQSQSRREPIVIDFNSDGDNQISLYFLDDISFGENAVYADMFNIEIGATEVPAEDLLV